MSPPSSPSPVSASTPPTVMRAHSRAMGLFLAICGLFIAIVGIWFIVLFAQEPRGTPDLALDYVLSGLFIMAGALTGWYAGWVLARPTAVRVTADGLVDEIGPLLCVGLIPWDEIVELRAHKVVFISTLAVWLREPDTILRRKPLPIRLLIAFYSRSENLVGEDGKPPSLKLDWSLVHGDVDGLVDEINATYADVIAVHGIKVRRDPVRGLWPFYRRIP